MCSLQEHSGRPEYKTDGVLVWQKVDGEWVDITPGADLALVDSSQSAGKE